MLPLAYSAGIVLWNMMQIWDEATNSFLAPLYAAPPLPSSANLYPPQT